MVGDVDCAQLPTKDHDIWPCNQITVTMPKKTTPDSYYPLLNIYPPDGLDQRNLATDRTETYPTRLTIVPSPGSFDLFPPAVCVETPSG